MGRYRIFTTLALSLFCSALALLIEFDPVKVDALFVGWLYHVPVVSVCALSLFFLIAGIVHFRKYKQRFYFLPLAVCLATLIICYWHYNYLMTISAREPAFTAHTNQIGSDGGLYLNFKKDGHLIVEKQDHGMLTTYWGNYKQKGDTVKLDVPLDFNFGRIGIFDSNSLRMLGDTIRLEVHR